MSMMIWFKAFVRKWLQSTILLHHQKQKTEAGKEQLYNCLCASMVFLWGFGLILSLMRRLLWSILCGLYLYCIIMVLFKVNLGTHVRFPIWFIDTMLMNYYYGYFPKQNTYISIKHINYNPLNFRQCIQRDESINWIAVVNYQRCLY